MVMNDFSTPEPSARGTIAAFLLVAVAIIGGMILLLATRPQPVQITIIPPQPTASPVPSPTPESITVYVTGAVGQPGALVTLVHGSRVQDAIVAAGGALASADTARVNLAGIVRDGDQVHVPVMGQDAPALPTPMGGAIVYINTASAEDLMTLPGVGAVLAARIIEYRDANGAFADLAALDAVEGIGASLLAQLEGKLSFE